MFSKISVVFGAALVLVSLGTSAMAATCTGGQSQDSISIAAVGSFTSCTTTNGLGGLSPDAGFVLISAVTGLSATSGSFSPSSGFSQLELIIQSSTGQPHPDAFDMVFAFVSPFTWVFNNPGSDRVIEATLYGLPSVSQVPLPAALPLFATGLGILGWAARRKKKQRPA